MNECNTLERSDKQYLHILHVRQPEWFSDRNVKWGRAPSCDHLVRPRENSLQLFVSPCHTLYNKLQSKERKREKMRERGIGVQQGKYSHPLWCALHSGIFHSSCLQPGFPPSANTIEQKFDKPCRVDARVQICLYRAEFARHYGSWDFLLSVDSQPRQTESQDLFDN